MKKSIVLILCLVLALSVSISAIACNRKSENGESVDVDYVAIDENGNTFETGRVYDMPNNIVFLSETDGEEGISIRATLVPESTFERELNWSVAWVDSASDFANGKVASDYVSITPNEEDNLICSIECLQAFGEQIKITARSVSKPDVYADCIVDFKLDLLNGTNYYDYYSYGFGLTFTDSDFDGPVLDWSDGRGGNQGGGVDRNKMVFHMDKTDSDFTNKMVPVLNFDLIPHTITTQYDYDIKLCTAQRPAPSWFATSSTTFNFPNLSAFDDFDSLYDVKEGFYPSRDLFITFYTYEIYNNYTYISNFIERHSLSSYNASSEFVFKVRLYEINNPDNFRIYDFKTKDIDFSKFHIPVEGLSFSEDSLVFS